MSILFKPKDAVCADFIPFYDNGKYHLFYLKDYRNWDQYGEGTPWFQIETIDFVDFKEIGEAIERGNRDELDLYVFTGSAIKKDDTYHIFYTGYNPHLKKDGKIIQGLLHATSKDMKNWKKDPDFISYAPSELGYETDDWRDPFVFWNEEFNEYWMLLAGIVGDAPKQFNGVTALMTSKDLKDWELQEPIYAPSLYFTHECPDMFKIGDWWYLIFSEFTGDMATRYQMSKSSKGPWITPKDDKFDTRAYYAAKTASDGDKRYLFGWLATRAGDANNGNWQWGGCLVVHELYQREDGTLAIRVPNAVKDAFKTPIDFTPKSIIGNWTIDANNYSINTKNAAICKLKPLELQECCIIECDITLKEDSVSCGVIFCNEDGSNYFNFKLEPFKNRFIIDNRPEPTNAVFSAERMANIKYNEKNNLKIIIQGSCIIAYLNDETAMSWRIYRNANYDIALYANDGDYKFQNLSIKYI